MDLDERRERERRRAPSSQATPLTLEERRSRWSDFMLIAMIVVAAIIGFGDITFSVQGLRDFTALAAFLYCVTTMTYRNRYNHGKQRGKLSKEYIEASAAYREAVESIPRECTNDMIAEYCEQYKERELKNFRRDLLMPFHVEYEDYEKTYSGLGFWRILFLRHSWSFRCALWRCNRAKPVRLSPSMLLNECGEVRRERVLGISGAQRERMDKLKEAVWRILISVGGGAIAVSIMFDFSWQSIAQWGIRIMPVLTAIISGDDAGYNDIAVTESAHKRGQAEIIKRMNEELAISKK